MDNRLILRVQTVGLGIIGINLSHFKEGTVAVRSFGLEEPVGLGIASKYSKVSITSCCYSASILLSWF